jgi:hypothetical protein
VVVASLAVDVWQALPAEKDVTRHLHRTLTGDNALTMLGIPAPAHESSSTDACASFACRNRGSRSSRNAHIVRNSFCGS